MVEVRRAPTTITIWRNRVITAVAWTTFALLGIATWNGGASQGDGGSAAFGIALTIVSVVAIWRALVGFSVEVRNDCLRINRTFWSTTISYGEIASVEAANKMVLVRPRLVLRVEMKAGGHRTFDEINQKRRSEELGGPVWEIVSAARSFLSTTLH